MPMLHILKHRCLYIKTHLRRALVPIFYTSNEPIVLIDLVCGNKPSPYKQPFSGQRLIFLRSECFRILFVYSIQQSSWKLMHANVCVMKAHRLISVTDQFVVSVVWFSCFDIFPIFTVIQLVKIAGRLFYAPQVNTCWAKILQLSW